MARAVALRRLLRGLKPGAMDPLSEILFRVSTKIVWYPIFKTKKNIRINKAWQIVHTSPIGKRTGWSMKMGSCTHSYHSRHPWRLVVQSHLRCRTWKDRFLVSCRSLKNTKWALGSTRPTGERRSRLSTNILSRTHMRVILLIIISSWKIGRLLLRMLLKAKSKTFTPSTR